jgi:AcrR family transcriptional regulator
LSSIAQQPATATADLKRAEIVAKAAALFDEKGYHRTSMDDIAAAVGIRKPTLYHYFQRKDEILFWIHEDVIDLIIKRYDARERTRMSDGQRLLEIIADILELMETRPGHARVFFEHFRELPPEQQEIVRTKRDRYYGLVEGVIRSGIESGEFRDVDPAFTTLMILGSCNWAYQWYRPEGPSRSREVAYAFWDVALRGLQATDK